MTALSTPSQLVIGLSHREMIDMMANAGIFCSVDKFARILQDAQRRALAHTTEKEEKDIAAVVDSQVSIDPAIAEFVDANFWDLLTDAEKAK